MEDKVEGMESKEARSKEELETVVSGFKSQLEKTIRLLD
jgi:hypothetical protein